MKKAFIVLGLVLSTFSNAYASEFITTEDLLVFKENTQVPNHILVRGKAASLIYDTLLSNGKKEIGSAANGESHIAGESMSCARFYWRGEVVKILCLVPVK